ncbi:MAG: hypothetical protein QG673_1274 [Pseudomonadota bacterium]|nr:hypothetical protein [Pseudomonadota bacterium]
MLDDLVLFIRIIETGNFKKAAELSNITTATLSKHITNLEYTLQKTLLIRDTRNIQLTEYGKFIYSKFKHLSVYTTIINNVKYDFDVTNSNVHESVYLVVGGGIGYALVNPFISEFIDAYPNIKLNIIYNNYIGNMDVGSNKKHIYLLPDYIKSHGIHSQLLRYEYAQFYCSNDYFQKFGAPESINDLMKNHKFIGLLDSSSKQALGVITIKNKLTNEHALLDTSDCNIRLDNPLQMKSIGMNSGLIFGCWETLCKEELKSSDLIPVLPEWVFHSTGLYLSHASNMTDAEKAVANFITRVCSI